MQSIGRITVRPELPERLRRLADLSRNLYWTWHPEAASLFARLAPRAWAESHNPVRARLGFSRADAERLAADDAYLRDLDAAAAAFDAYMGRADTWFRAHHPDSRASVAYFSMEYGFHESLQIYSGGLGVLAGDHCKSASDLGLPFVAVGLLFRQGYFHQQLGADGWQNEWYETVSPETQPLEPLKIGRAHV